MSFYCFFYCATRYGGEVPHVKVSAWGLVVPHTL